MRVMLLSKEGPVTQMRREARPIRLEVAAPGDAGRLALVAALGSFDDRKWMREALPDEILAADDPSKGPPHTPVSGRSASSPT
jgi:hypothetical protein